MGAALESLVDEVVRVPTTIRWQQQTPLKTILLLFLKWKALAHVNPCFPLRRVNLLLLWLSHHPFLEHLLESIIVILSVICLSQNMVNCGIILMLLSLISLLLVFTWTSEVPGHLCFAVQIRASEIPLYHALLWLLQSCRCFINFILWTLSWLILFIRKHDC